MSVGIGTDPLARKRPGEKAEKTPIKRKARDEEPRPIALTIRGREAWKDWVKKFAEFDRSSLNGLIDRALASYARERGFKEPPPER